MESCLALSMHSSAPCSVKLIRDDSLAQVVSLLSLSLFRPPGPAAAGLVGLYILLLHFLSFFDRGTYR